MKTEKKTFFFPPYLKIIVYSTIKEWYYPAIFNFWTYLFECDSNSGAVGSSAETDMCR